LNTKEDILKKVNLTVDAFELSS